MIEASQLCLGSETCADSELLVGLDGLNSIGLGVAYWNWSVPVPVGCKSLLHNFQSPDRFCTWIGSCCTVQLLASCAKRFSKLFGDFASASIESCLGEPFSAGAPWPGPVDLQVFFDQLCYLQFDRTSRAHWACELLQVPVLHTPPWDFDVCVQKSWIGCSGPATTVAPAGDRVSSLWPRLCWALFRPAANFFSQSVALVQKSRIGCSGSATIIIGYCTSRPALLWDLVPHSSPSLRWGKEVAPISWLLSFGSKFSSPPCDRMRVHKSRIGCSGSATAPASMGLYEALLWLSLYLPTFFLQLLLASCFVLLRVFLIQLGFRRCIPGRCFLAPFQGPHCNVLLAWGRISCVYPHAHGILPRDRRSTAGARKAKQLHGNRLPPSLCWSAWLLAFLSCPVQVWAAPKPWGEAVDIILETVRLFPDPMPDDRQSAGSNVPFWARPGFQPECISEPPTEARVLDHPDIPVPPHAEELPDDSDRSFVQAYCFVMSPRYQAEVVPLQLGIPTDMQTFSTQVRRSLNSLRLRFVSEIIPTVPQLSSEFASVLVVPKWLNASNRQVIVFDLRACGGPVYPDYVHDRVTYGECLAVGRRHDIEDCAVYAQGHTQPLCSGSSFLAFPGGVVQFQPAGTPAEWRSPLHVRLDRPNDWLGDPNIPDEEVEWPLYVSHHDAFSLYSADRFPGESAAQAIAGLVDRRPGEALFVTSPGQQLEDVCVRGVSCRDVMAVFPVTPSADRTGALVFLDFRQLGLEVTHLYLDQSAVSPTDVILRHHLRPPPGFKITCWPRPDHTGRIPVVEGDILLFGYVPDSWDSDDELDSDSSDSSSNPASDTSSPRASRAASPPPGEPSRAPLRPAVGPADTHRADRSRSPRGSGDRHAHGDHAADVTRSPPSSVAPAVKGDATGDVPACMLQPPARMFVRKWSSGTRQQAIADGTPEITSVTGLPAHAQALPTFPLVSEALSALAWWLPKAHTTLLADQPESELEWAHRLLEHKVLIEPGSSSPDSRRRLEDLRSVTIALGGAWPFHSPFNGRVPGTLRDSEEEDSAPHPHLCWVQVLVLKCLYVPEKLSVAIGLPATPLEATTVIQGARPLTLSRDFPHLIAAAPQPFSEACVYIANPSWYGFDMVACADLTCIDGRIFAVRLPDYADRRVVLAHVDLPPGSHITVYVGFLEAPLQDGVPLHLFPGVTLRFLPDDQPPAPALAISEMLQSMAFLNTEGVNPEVAPADYYCLVLRYSYKLFRADNLLPWQYRERFAGAIGCTASQVSIFPATPRAIDVAIEGCPCRTALAVVPTSFVTEEVNSYCFLVDARPILQGWMCFRTRTSPIGAALVLRELNAEAPLGLRATLDDVATLDALIDVGPGQILVARYIPLEDLPNLGDPVGHPGEVEWELLPPIHPTDESSDDSNPPQEESMEGNYQVLVPCMLFMTDYCPELYEVALYLPAEPDELVDGVLDARSQQRQENSPCPHFVRPQPDTAFASLLMLPLWPVEHCVVLVDGRTVDQRLFAICLAPLIDRRSLLIAAAYEPDQPLDVYVRDSPWPLRADTAIPLYTGDLVVVTFSTQLAPGTGHLIQMLGSPDSWDSAAVPVEPTVRFTLILQESDSFLIANHSHELDGVESSDSVDSIDARTAEHLGIDEGDLILYAAFPGVDDHWERGRPVDRVLIAIRHPQGLAGTDTRTACVIDARPIFMGIQGSALSGRVLDCSTLIDRLVHFCPVGFVVTITGGASGIALPNGLREVQNGTVLSVHFRAMDTAIVSSYDAADASPTTDGPPSRNRASALPLVLFAPGADWLDVSLGRGQRRRHTCGSCRLLPSREPMRTCLVSAAAFMQFNLSMASKQSDLYCSSMWAASPCHDVYCIRPWCLTSAVVSLSAAFLRALIGAGTLWGFLGLLSLVWILISRAQQHGRKPSGCAKTVPAASPPSRSDNRQRRSRHNGPSHWQGPPQGHGAGSGAPSPSDTNEDPDPANQVHTIDPPHVSTETGFGTRVPFLIYSHEYGPEQVVARLVLPARVREAWAALEQRRTASAQRRSPRLIPVFPQPRDGVACVLALPHWDFEGVPVLVDCHVAPAKLFCALLPGWILRESFLQYLGIPIDLPCHVFLRDIPWPLQAGAYLFPQSGDLVTVHIPPAAPGPPVELSQLLEPDHVWDFTFDPPGNSGDINWVLSDGIHVALPLLGDSFALSSAHTAEALGLEAGQFTLVPALPAIEDHARLGINSQRVFAACRTDSSSDGSRVPYILDQRPILLHMYMALATDGILDVAAVCRRVSWLCPRKYHVRLLGGQFSDDHGNHYRRVTPGTVITVEFHPDYLREVFSASHTESFALDAEPFDSAIDPNRWGHHAGHSSMPPADGGTGGTSQAPASTAAPTAAPFSLTASSVQDRDAPANRAHPALFIWQQVLWGLVCSIPCRLLVLLSILSSEVVGAPLPRVELSDSQLWGGFAGPVDGIRQQETALCSEIPSATCVGHRPVPTPCRSRQGFGLLLEPTPPASGLDIGHCYTLLEECIADQSCPAFWLTSTLLETVIEHFATQADGCSPDIGDATGPTDQALDLRLFDYLPSAITVDLSHVSLPLQQSIDQVLQWTFQGSWALTSALPADIQLHPAARRLLALCPPGELERQERISIFTDGSYGKGIASWAFVVLGASEGRTHFLGWAAGRVPTDPSDPLFLCHCRQHALSGEQTALFWATVWALQSPHNVPVQMFSDCLVALQQAQGLYGWSTSDDLEAALPTSLRIH